MSYLKHKPGSIEELVANEATKLNDNAYQDMFKKELDKAGKGIGGMSPKEKKDFFNKIDDKYKAKNEEKDVPKGSHKMPDGTVMKDSEHKKEVKEEDAYDKDDEKPAKPKPKKEDLVGGQKKLDKDKDGDLDAKDFAALRKTKSEAVKTGEADAEPKVKELNAMVKSSHKPDHKGNPIDDMNAGYMKSNVKAPVTNKGGADMAVVKDAPKMVAAMAKISNEKKMMNMKAMYGESRENAKRYLDTKPGSLEEAVLKSRGLVK